MNSFFALSLSFLSFSAEAAPVDFNDQVQPILSEYCYHCHGPDSSTRKPKGEPLRLDSEEYAFQIREDLGVPSIIKGDAKNSELILRLHSDDKTEVMPPPESHKTMSAEEIEILTRWIDEGAEYEEHWSFLPPEKPPTALPESAWTLNEIDPFIEAKLSAAGLRPNEAENPERFYRRLHFDLTGLPPHPDDVAAFRWENLATEVDRLLATAASAEHFARQWLDVARYADTHGIHIDNYRAIWPYRDWVIQAFHDNMPWDQFTIEQQAGDLLPNATLDQKVATGFHRCLPTTGEGGAIAEEYNAIYAQDRVDTTAAAWLGLTTGCASCHDHKFDPISTKEFYALTAFFRNTPMSALDQNNAEHPPNIFVPRRADREDWLSLESEINEARGAIAVRKIDAAEDFAAWLPTAKIEHAREIDSSLHLHLPFSESEGPLRGVVDGAAQEWPAKVTRIEGPFGMAPVISDSPIDLGDLASFSRADKVSYGGYLYTEKNARGAVIARMDPRQKFRGWDLWLENGKPGAHVIDSWTKAATKTIARTALKPSQWQHVMVTFDGSQPGHRTLQIYIDGKPAGGGPNPNTVGGRIETEVPLRLGSRHGNNAQLHGTVALQDFRFYRRLLPPSEIQNLALRGKLCSILATPSEKRNQEQRDTLFDYYLSSNDEETRRLTTHLDKLIAQREALRSRGSVSLVMKEKKGEPFAHVLNRGQYADLGERVTPGTPAALPPLPEGAPANRLGLAQWLVARENPLPARVTMNRLWQSFFGNGIVETTGDFGIMGSRPSHPLLLDWLAVEFMDSGWDHRHMVKLLVTSATYRQSAVLSAEKLELDPLNRLLSRGPRYRLDAEQLRDLVLTASDSLSRTLGGPSVRPYQPVGIWSSVAMPQSNTRDYVPDKGEGLYRRSLYTFWKRTAPHPAMEILNAPSREVSCTSRERTNTPLQAFVTLNDPQFVEASRRLAENALTEQVATDQRLDYITSRLLSRTLSDAERPVVLATLATALTIYEKQPEEAKALLSVGESPADEQLPVPELAAWTVLASQILNLDETLTK